MSDSIEPLAPQYVPKYLRVSAVKQLIREGGRRCKPEFIEMLDRMVGRKVKAACAIHNGGCKTLDASIAGYVGISK